MLQDRFQISNGNLSKYFKNMGHRKGYEYKAYERLTKKFVDCKPTFTAVKWDREKCCLAT